MGVVPITFNNLSEGLRECTGPDLATVLGSRVTGIFGGCEAPLNDGAIGEVAEGDSAMAPLVASLQASLDMPLNVRVVPLHSAFVGESQLSGLALVTPYPVTSTTFHQLESPTLKNDKGQTIHSKGVLRCVVNVGGRRLTICVLQLPPAHRFNLGLDAPAFSGMRRSLANAIRGADVIMGDFNNRGVSLTALGVDLDRFSPVLEGEVTRQGYEEQVDWILVNRSAFPTVSREIAWSTSDHAVLMADLNLR